MGALTNLPALRLGGDPWVFTIDPSELVPLALVAVLYARRLRTLSRRGRPVVWWRPACFATGLLLLLVALASPVDYLGEERLLSVHMFQHLLLGELAPLLLVLGMTGPILRPLLALRPVRGLRLLAHPLLALPVWVGVLLGWHLSGPYQAALANEGVHALQHLSFLIAGLLVWAALFEPLPGPDWFGSGLKVGYLIVLWLTGQVLGYIFVLSRTLFYPAYAAMPRLWGLSPLGDQQAAGGLAVAVGMAVTVPALGWFAWRWICQSGNAQILVEQGLEPARALRAARYGRS